MNATPIRTRALATPGRIRAATASAARPRSPGSSGGPIVVDDDGSRQVIGQAAPALREEHGDEAGEERHDREQEPDEAEARAADRKRPGLGAADPQTVAVLFLLVTDLKTTGAIGWIGDLVYLAAILFTELLTNNALLF